jgi:hypothetical protein
MSRADGGERAQASVEVVALVPALALVLLCAWEAAMAGWALTAAESASRAGARAAAAAFAALPASMRAGATASESGGRIVVTLRVPTVVPGFAPRISSSTPVVRQ